MTASAVEPSSLHRVRGGARPPSSPGPCAEFTALIDPEGYGLDTEDRDFVLAARETMVGLALGRTINGGRPLGHEQRVIDRLRAEAAGLDRRRSPR